MFKSVEKEINQMGSTEISEVEKINMWNDLSK